MQYRYDREGNFVKVGGYNSYDGEVAEDAREARKLEERLTGYISTDEMTEAEKEKLFESDAYWFESLFEEGDKLYIYKPSFDDLMAETEIEDYTRYEIDTSSVLISYDYYERAEGTQEQNDVQQYGIEQKYTQATTEFSESQNSESHGFTIIGVIMFIVTVILLIIFNNRPNRKKREKKT